MHITVAPLISPYQEVRSSCSRQHGGSNTSKTIMFFLSNGVTSLKISSIYDFICYRKVLCLRTGKWVVLQWDWDKWDRMTLLPYTVKHLNFASTSFSRKFANPVKLVLVKIKCMRYLPKNGLFAFFTGQYPFLLVLTKGSMISVKSEHC